MLLPEKVTNTVYDVVFLAYMQGLATRGDFARTNAELVAAAASSGLITTMTPDRTFGNTWRVTYQGLFQLTNGGHL